MADHTSSSGIGITLGGAIVIAGILVAIFWSVIVGVIVALVGLLAFGGFARGRVVLEPVGKLLTGEWVIDRTSAKQRRIAHYWLTILWFTVGLVLWVVLRNELWFVGFMSLYAIWITHLAGWAAETPVEAEDEADYEATTEPPPVVIDEVLGATAEG